MNEIINNFLSAGNIFMPEMHLKQSGFTYSARGPSTKNKERIQKFKKTEDTNYIYKNKPNKACFQHDMAYGDFQDLARRTASDKSLTDKAFNIAQNHKYDGCQSGLASIVYKFFDKKSSDIAYGDFQDLERRAASDKNLTDKVFNITKNPKYDGYQRGLAFKVYSFLIKSLQAVVLICANKNVQIKKLSKTSVHWTWLRIN